MRRRATVAYAAVGTAAGLIMALGANVAHAYPEFETYVEKVSGRYINCAMCHTHPDGPEGLKPGQIGSLNQEQMQQLNRARGAFEPGQRINSPILNEFGDHIINELGKQKFLQLRMEPEELATILPEDSDLDRDGIPDVDEYMDGTHPLDAQHGAPARLFLMNLQRRWFHLAMLIAATLFGLIGLNAFLNGFNVRFRNRRAAGNNESMNVRDGESSRAEQ